MGSNRRAASPAASPGFDFAASCPKQDHGKVLEVRKIKLQWRRDGRCERSHKPAPQVDSRHRRSLWFL
jgi:hypothetical protein